MDISDDARPNAQRSHLFMLRIWLEDVNSGKTGWRGKVQHVNSGDIRYFRDWSTLEDFMEELIFQPGSELDSG